MNKWKAEIILNSGKEVAVKIECDENNSGDVAKNYFSSSGNIKREFIGYSSVCGKKNVFICIQDISVLTISQLE